MSARPIVRNLLALCLVAGLVSAEPLVRDPAAGVRAAREAFNRAIAAKNAAGIRAALSPSYSVVTGRGDKLTGRDEEVRRWIGRFRADRRMTYERTPTDIVVNPAWGLAHETGTWTGRYTSEALLVNVSGVYSARWQRGEGGSWQIDAEIFVTLACEGPASGCVKPDPIP